MKALALFFAMSVIALAGCTSKPAVSVVNKQAALAGQLPHNPLAWKVITSSVNERNGTMSTLYGDDVAVQYARSNSGGTYPASSVLALVTWAQRDDPHWFGARIPSNAKSVEFVSFTADGAKPSYERYEGPPLSRAASSDADGSRVNYLVSQRAAVMP
jgi:hypothetical protein